MLPTTYVLHCPRAPSLEDEDELLDEEFPLKRSAKLFFPEDVLLVDDFGVIAPVFAWFAGKHPMVLTITSAPTTRVVIKYLICARATFLSPLSIM